MYQTLPGWSMSHVQFFFAIIVTCGKNVSQPHFCGWIKYEKSDAWKACT
jgi:hypothetical protein